MKINNLQLLIRSLKGVVAALETEYKEELGEVIRSTKLVDINSNST